MTEKRLKLAERSITAGWGYIRLWIAAAAVAAGGWQMAQVDWSQARQTMDHALWSHALEGRPAPTHLRAAAPVWREREGASGDRIVERVDGQSGAETLVAIMGNVSGKAIAGHLLAQPATRFASGERLNAEPAAFEGLSAGDRLTISTTDGRVYTFQVGPQKDESESNSVEITIRIAPTDEDAPALHGITPINPHTSETRMPQQNL